MDALFEQREGRKRRSKNTSKLKMGKSVETPIYCRMLRAHILRHRLSGRGFKSWCDQKLGGKMNQSNDLEIIGLDVLV